MAPKNLPVGKDRLMGDDEEVLQAVILADSFNKRFRPLTTQKPRCLLPVCNAPLLDWTFESLALAGVQEVYVVIRSHASQVKRAIKDSKWSKPGSGMKIVPVMTAKETFSPGDAMRDIYTRGLVTSDFVLVMGDLVSNIRIDEVVRVHKERRKTNKDAIMTMVVKESGIKHRTRIQPESAVFVVDPNTSECLHYEAITGYPPTTVARIPRGILAEHPEIEIRNDLIDCSIDICSVEVPSLFQDNFDYSDIRRDFVHGILTSDLLMKNIHVYVAKEGYAARVKDTRSYNSVSKDILSRWTFPLVPDDNHPSGHVYEQLRGNKYLPKDNSVSLARCVNLMISLVKRGRKRSGTCKVGNNTLIGPSSKLGENVSIIASVLGKNVVVGAGSTIKESYIFEGSVIGNHCTISSSIIGAGVTIHDHTVVPRGCLIADGVILGPNVVLQPFDRISKRRSPGDSIKDESRAVLNDSDEETGDGNDDDDDDDDLDEIEANFDTKAQKLGPISNGVLWPNGPPEGDIDTEDVENYQNQAYMRIGDNTWDPSILEGEGSSSSDEGSSDESDEDNNSSGLHYPSSAVTSITQSSGESEFQLEVKYTLERAFTEGHSIENAAVELKTLRMASNVNLSLVREAVIAGILEHTPIVEDTAAQRQAVATVVARWGALIDQIGGVNPSETLAYLQKHCANSPERLGLFGRMMASLYEEDIVAEDDIRNWHATGTAKGEGQQPDIRENYKRCWMIGARMIQQFDEQESEEESDEDDD